MTRVCCAHHVLGIKHLLRQLRYRESTILLGAARSQRCKASHEEVQTREGHQVHRDLAQVAVQLSGEAQAASHTAHGCRHQVVQVTIGWCGQLQRAEAYVVQCLVVQQEGLI